MKKTPPGVCPMNKCGKFRPNPTICEGFSKVSRGHSGKLSHSQIIAKLKLRIRKCIFFIYNLVKIRTLKITKKLVTLSKNSR